MNCFTHCPSCKYAILYGYGNGYVCCLTECKYELAEYNNRVITSKRTLADADAIDLIAKEMKGGKR